MCFFGKKNQQTATVWSHTLKASIDAKEIFSELLPKYDIILFNRKDILRGMLVQTLKREGPQAVVPNNLTTKLTD